jgi:hypothetical protein
MKPILRDTIIQHLRNQVFKGLAVPRGPFRLPLIFTLLLNVTSNSVDGKKPIIELIFLYFIL